MPKKYPLPDCLRGQRTDEPAFVRWLRRKAKAHVRRDRKRGSADATGLTYTAAIYAAVVATGGRDYFTGKPLDWHLISKWDNAEATRQRGGYKREFWNLPTVDHEDPRNPGSPLRLCSWQVNDVKNDLTIEELLGLTDAIRAHLDRS